MATVEALEVLVVALVTLLTLGGAWWVQSREVKPMKAVELLNRLDLDEIKRRVESIENRTWT